MANKIKLKGHNWDRENIVNKRLLCFAIRGPWIFLDYQSPFPLTLLFSLHHWSYPWSTRFSTKTTNYTLSLSLALPVFFLSFFSRKENMFCHTKYLSCFLFFYFFALSNKILCNFNTAKPFINYFEVKKYGTTFLEHEKTPSSIRGNYSLNQWNIGTLWLFYLMTI